MGNFTTKTEQLLCTLTDEEMRERGHRMGGLRAELEGIELRKKSLTADLTAEKKRLEAEQSKLAMILREGQELRDVQVEVHRDYAHGEQIERRTDTDAIVRKRTLTIEEMQTELPLDAMNRMVDESQPPEEPKDEDDDKPEPEATP